MNERTLLYKLARDRYSGRGAIVDAGSFVGASASALACGVEANRKLKLLKWLQWRGDNAGLIHCYDGFVVDARYMEQFLASAGWSVPHGESFRHVFNEFTTAHAHRIIVHEGDWLSETWTGGEIEILFVDICKLPKLTSHMIGRFFPNLMPGRSIVIHQDYHHPHLPWIHITTECLRDSFEVVEERVGDSIVLELARPFDPVRLQRCVDYAFSETERRELMDRALARLRPESRAVASLASVTLTLLDEGVGPAREELDALRVRYARDSSDSWQRYLREMDARLLEVAAQS